MSRRKLTNFERAPVWLRAKSFRQYRFLTSLLARLWGKCALVEIKVGFQVKLRQPRWQSISYLKALLNLAQSAVSSFLSHLQTPATSHVFFAAATSLPCTDDRATLLRRGRKRDFNLNHKIQSLSNKETLCSWVVMNINMVIMKNHYQDNKSIQAALIKDLY